MNALKFWVASRRKAIVAAVVSVAVGLASKWGLDLTADQVAALSAALAAITVYLVPNEG